VTARRLGVAAAVVDGTIVPGDVEVDGGTVGAVGVAPAGRSGLAVAGFVDLQVNGFAGVDFTVADTDGYGRALAAMARHGVTACLPTVPTAAPDAYLPALDELAAVMAEPPPGTRVLGAHLEGPFLAPARRGAHRADWLRAPDPDLLAVWAGRAPVALLTLAPELPGADRLIAAARRAGIVVSLGHSEATAAEAHAAFDAGATMVTHLWNAQRVISAREPGVTGAALARPDVRVGLIADLVHVAADTLRVSLTAAGRRAFVVTDALEPAGLAPGRYRRSDGRMQRSDGVAVRLDDGVLAGSVLTLDAAVRNVVQVGLTVVDALDLVSASPARALGRDDLGRLGPGRRADVVVLDDRLEVRSVLVGGTPAT
jgi:N-acetylglucosamine-6-phosphate deacetylase